MWLDQFKVKMELVDEHTTKFSSPFLKSAVYVVDQDYQTRVYLPHAYHYYKGGWHEFDDENEVLSMVKDIFHRAYLNDRMKLLQKQMQDDYFIISKYQTGDIGISLLERDENFFVALDGNPVLKTDDLSHAIDAYYQQITSILMAKDEDKDLALELFGQKVMMINMSAMERLDNLIEGQSQKWFKELLLSYISKYEPAVGRFHQMPMPNQQEGDDANTWQHGGVGRKDLKEEDYKKPKKNLLQEPIDGGTDKPHLPPAGDGMMATTQAFPAAVVKEFDPMQGRVKPEDGKIAYLAGEEKIKPQTISGDARKKIMHPPENKPIEAAGVDTINPSVQKDFPKQPEGGWIGELDEHPEGKDKIGDKQKPIEGMKKTQGVSMKPSVINDKTQEPIEHDDKYMKQMTFDTNDAIEMAEKLHIDFNKEKFDPIALARGMEVELEHHDVTGGDKVMTAKIALAHLKEDPQYYEKLAKIEKGVQGASTPYATGAFPNPAELTNQEQTEENKEDAPLPNKENAFSKTDELFDEIDGMERKALDHTLPPGAKELAQATQKRVTRTLKMSVYRWLHAMDVDAPIIVSINDLRKELDKWRTSSLPHLESNMYELMNKGLKVGMKVSKVPVPDDEEFKPDIEDFRDAVKQIEKEVTDHVHQILKAGVKDDFKLDKKEIRKKINEFLGKLDSRVNLMVRTETSKLIYLGLLLALMFLPDKDKYNYYWVNPADERSKDISLDRMQKSPYNYDTINFLWTHQEEFINGRWQADQYNNRCHIEKRERNDDQVSGNKYAGEIDRFKRTSRIIRKKKQKDEDQGQK